MSRARLNGTTHATSPSLSKSRRFFGYGLDGGDEEEPLYSSSKLLICIRTLMDIDSSLYYWD